MYKKCYCKLSIQWSSIKTMVVFYYRKLQIGDNNDGGDYDDNNGGRRCQWLLSPNLGTGYSGGSIGITRGTGSFTITNNSYSAIPANTPYYVVRC